MSRVFNILVFDLFLICCCDQLVAQKFTAFRSTLPIEKVNGISGLYLLRAPKFSGIFSNSLTFCMRFKLSRLKVRILELSGESGSHELLWLWITAKDSYFALDANTGGWLLKDPVSGEFNIWRSGVWHHFCISYDSKSLLLSFIKVKNALQLCSRRGADNFDY